MIVDSLETHHSLWSFYASFGVLKICPQILGYSSLQKVEPNFPPLECGLDLSIQTELPEGTLYISETKF